MKGKINTNGNLFVLRNGTWKTQCCTMVEDRSCGDWCPIFHETHSIYDGPGGGVTNEVFPGCANRGEGIPILDDQRCRQKDKKEELSLRDLANKIENNSVTLPIEADEDGNTVRPVTVDDIVDAYAKIGISIDRSMFILSEPITKLGVYPVITDIEKSTPATAKVWVVEDRG